MEFSRNGMGRTRNRSREKSIWFTWTVQGDVLETGPGSPEFAKTWAQPIAQRVFNWTWHTLTPVSTSYKILSISENEIRLSFEGELLDLTRIPE